MGDTYPYTNWVMAATNIQTALDAATSDYDIVFVADGTYAGPQNRNLQFPANPIMLISTNGATNCIVDGDATDCVFYFNNGQGLETVLSDITIRNGSPTGWAAGITCIGSEPTIQYCMVEVNGGIGVGCYATSDAKIDACVISGNSDDGIDSSESSPAVTNCIIVGNYAGIWAYNGGAPRIDDCTIYDNGYGIVCQSTAIITRCTIFGNYYGVYALETNPVIDTCSIYYNFYDGIFCDAVSPTVANCLIAGNGANGIRSFNGSPSIADSTIINSSSNGIYCDSSAAVISNCSISGNGFCGIYATNGSPTISGCTIRSNTTVGVYCEQANPTIRDCEISWNGYGMYLSEWNPHVDGCLILNNQNDGIYCQGSSYLLIENCTIGANEGDGVYCYDANPTIENCTITSNVRGVYGEQSDAYIGSSAILNNEGDGIYLYDSNPTIKDTIIGDNDWDGVVCYTSSPSLYNCTLANNKWNGIHYENGSAPELQNCIIWGNSSDQVYGWGSPNITYSAVQGGWSGAGNITNNPLMVPLSYRLQANSPCIDAGSSTSASTNDIDGEGRWDDPGHSNIVSIVDMGADEFYDDDLDDMADVWEMYYFGSTNANPTNDADSDDLNNLGEYQNGACPTNSNTDVDSSLDGEEVAVGTDPLNATSFPVDVSGSIAYAGGQTGSIWVVAVTTSNSWATNHSSSLTVTGAYSMTDIPNLTNYWCKAFRDSDGDGIQDATEAWGAYISNSVYVATNVTGVDITLQDPDDDQDGLPDWWEIAHFTNLSQTATGDADGDGLNNLAEYEHGSDPSAYNTDNDSISDGDEVGVGFDPAISNSYVLYADFEPTNGYETGALDGQNGWVASSSNGVRVQVGVVRRGEQAVWLEGLQENMAKTCSSVSATNIARMYVFLGNQQQPPTNLPSTASCLVSFNSTNGLVAFDGDGSGGGTWVVATNTLLTEQWVQLGIEQNYSNQTWKLYVNGIEKLGGLGFKSSSVTNLNGLHLQSGTGGSIYYDDMGITEQ